MTTPDVANPLIGTTLVASQAPGATAIAGQPYNLLNVWKATLDPAAHTRAIRGYFISGPPSSPIDIWFENTIDDSTVQMGTACSVEYDAPHDLYRGLTLAIIVRYYAGRMLFDTSLGGPPIIRVFYYDQAQPGY